MNVPTVKKQWEIYLNRCYGPDIPVFQREEIKQAFMSGALVALMMVMVIRAKTKKERVVHAAIHELFTEVDDYCKQRIVDKEAQEGRGN